MRIEDITIGDIVDFIVRVRCRLLRPCPPEPPPESAVADFDLTIIMQGVKNAMTATVGQGVIAQISNIVDAAGNPVTPKSPPVWSTSDPTILDLVPDLDGMAARGATLKAGTVVVLANVDGIVRTASLDVASGDVANFDLTISLAPPAAPK